MPQKMDLTGTMNDSATAPALPHAVEIKRPSIFQAAFNRDMYRFKNILSQMAEKMDEQGVSVSSLHVEQGKNTLDAKIGLFDRQGRETTLNLHTVSGLGGPFRDRPTRWFQIDGEKSDPSGPYKPGYHFRGGTERVQPSHWAKNPADDYTFSAPSLDGDDKWPDVMTYNTAFNDTARHGQLAGHLAKKMVEGFKHDVDHDGYQQDRREEYERKRIRPARSARYGRTLGTLGR